MQGPGWMGLPGTPPWSYASQRRLPWSPGGAERRSCAAGDGGGVGGGGGDGDAGAAGGEKGHRLCGGGHPLLWTMQSSG